MIDLKAFFSLNYGLYIISSKQEAQTAGCVVNTLTQVTAVPEQMTVAVHKQNFTAGVIEQSGFFTAVVLAQAATMDLIGRFGFRSSKDTDKFAGFQTKTDENGIPYLCEQVVARISCKVIDSIDIGTHILFLGKVTAAETLDTAEPLTYSYYHQVKKGTTPPKASSYQATPDAQTFDAPKGYRCTICGYIHPADTLPDDFVCPICKRTREVFEKIQ